jgi:hypothetical protein
LFSVFFAPLAEAGRRTPDIEIEPNIRIGTSARSVAKAVNTKFKCFGEHRDFKAWYKSCDPAERKGCRLLLTAAREHGDKAPAMMRMMRDLRDIEKQLVYLPSHLQPVSLKRLCREITELHAYATRTEAHKDELQRLQKTLFGIMTRVKETGVPKPKTTIPTEGAILGGVSEILELNRARRRGELLEIAPSNNFREALCEGGMITGKWYLEVKNWPFFGNWPGGALLPIKSLSIQIERHIRFTSDLVDDLKNLEIPVENIPGMGYRFLRASANDSRFQQYSDHIKAEFLYRLMEKVKEGLDAEDIGNLAKIAELEKRVAQYVDNRVVIQLAKDNP